VDRALAIVPLTARGFAVLYEIHRETPASQGDLARRLGLEPSTTSELLKRPERGALVRRAISARGPGGRSGPGPMPPRPGDRRPNAVALTEPGRAALAQAERIVSGIEEAWARRLAAAAGTQMPRLRLMALRRWLTENRDCRARLGSPALA
jgi:DNA-binding MarR family transcriptional regulator